MKDLSAAVTSGWALLLILVVSSPTEGAEKSVHTVSGGGVVLNTLDREVDPAFLGEATHLHFEGLGQQSGVGTGRVTITLDGEGENDVFGFTGFLGSGQLGLAGDRGQELRLYVDLSIRARDPQGRPIPAPFPVEGTFDVGGGSSPFGSGVGYGRITGHLTPEGALIYKLDGEITGGEAPGARSEGGPAGPVVQTAAEINDGVSVLFFEGARFIADRSAPGSGLPDFGSAPFERVREYLLSLAGRELVLPLSTPDGKGFEDLVIPGTIPVSIDRDGRSFTVHAGASPSGEPTDYLFTGRWKSGQRGHFTLCARFPGFRFGDWNGTLQDSFFDQPNLSYATVLLTSRSSDSKAPHLSVLSPGRGDALAVGEAPEYHFHRQIRLYELERLAASLRTLGVEDAEIGLQGTLEIGSTNALPLAPGQHPYARSLFLSAELPPAGLPLSLAAWPEGAREELRAAKVLARRLELSHAEGSSQAWLVDVLRLRRGDHTVELFVATELSDSGIGATRARLATPSVQESGWLTLREAERVLEWSGTRPELEIDGPGRKSGTRRLGPFALLSLTELTDLLRTELGNEASLPALAEGLPAGALDLHEVNLEISTGGPTLPSFTVNASATILGTVPAEVMLSSLSLDGSSLDVLLSLRPQQLTLGQIYPESQAADVAFPAFVFSYLETSMSSPVTLSAESLSGGARGFYSPVLGEGSFTFALDEGVNVVATYPLAQLPGLISQTLGIDPADQVVVEGSLGMSLAELASGDVDASRGMYLSATLPTPSTPPAFPDLLQGVELTALTLELVHLKPETVARIRATLKAILDGEPRTFTCSAVVALGETPSSITFAASMDGDWPQPFGVSWLELERVGALLSFDTDGSKRVELYELAGRLVSLNIELAGSSSGGTVAFTGRVDQLSPAELTDLLVQHSGISPPAGGLLPGIVDLRDVTMTFAAGGGTAFGISADVAYEVELDGLVRRFAGPAELQLSGGELAVSLDASLEGPWDQPFGLAWLSLEDVSLHLTAGDQQAAASYRSSFLLGGKQVELEIEVSAGGNGSSARLAGSVDQLSVQELTQLVQMHLPAVAPFEGSSLDLTFSNVTMTLEVGTRNAFSIGATTELNGRVAELLFSATETAGKTQVVTGLQLHGWSLSHVLPALEGSAVDQFQFDTVVLLLTKATGTLDAPEMSPEVYDFFRRVHLTDDFRLDLQPGVSLIATTTLADTSALHQPLAALGSGVEQLAFGGSLPGQVLGLGSGGEISLRASLPPMSPALPDGSKPPWFRSGQLAFFLGTGQGGTAAGIEGTLDLTIDDVAMAFIVAGTFGGTPPAITLSGLLVAEEPWIHPFGIGFLTVEELGLALSVDPVTASLGLGFHGRAEAAAKNFEIDIVLELNVATGVPTNFVFRGASHSTFSLADLILLQQQSGGPAVPNDLLPALEIRPIDSASPIEVKFALQETAFVQQGLALSGALYAATPPSTTPELVAVVDAEISTSGIFLFGQAPHDLGVGGLSLNHPTVSVSLEPLPPAGSFLLRGELVLPWFTRTVDVLLDPEAKVAEELQKISAIVSSWSALVTTYAQDPVAAVRSSLDGPDGLFAVADVPEPPWLDPLLDGLTKMQDLFPGSDSRTLLEYALTGADITVPAGSGFPAGGRNPEGCPLGQTLYQGRCWTETPFAGQELGYVYLCPTGIEEAGLCWIVPPSATSLRSKESYCCQHNWKLQCTKTCWRCPAGTVESGGKCYNLPVGPPSLSTPSSPQKTCFGHDIGGKCWKLGHAPRTGSPAGGADQRCPVVAPIYSGGRCWVLPPTPEVQLDRIPGICAAQGTSCSVDGLLSVTLSTLIEGAVKALVDSVSPRQN